MRNNGINDFSYVLLGTKMVSNRDEQHQHEQKFIDELEPSLNKNKAYRTAQDFK